MRSTCWAIGSVLGVLMVLLGAALSDDVVEGIAVARVVEDTFMSWVTVGEPGNKGEPSGEGAGGFGATRVCGRVDYVYRIGKYEVTNAQYCVFLNAVASRGDPHRLYHPGMGTHRFGGILRLGAPGQYRYTVKTGMERKPVNFVSFFDACRFANWMHNGRGAGDTEAGAYALGGTTTPANAAVTRRPGARVVVTSEDEWYKAAYYKNDGKHAGYWDHATRSDAPAKAELPPGGVNSANCMTVNRLTDVGAYVNSPSPFGTCDQCGNVWEWNEAILGNKQQFRAARGGCYGSMDLAADRTHKPTYWQPTLENEYIGFRVAEVPPDATPAPAPGPQLDAKQVLNWLKRHPDEARWILEELGRSRGTQPPTPEATDPMPDARPRGRARTRKPPERD